MRKLIFLSILFLVPSVCHAESYAIKKPDGTVAIANYFNGSHDTLEDFLRANGLDKLPRFQVTEKELPSKEDRKYWDISSGRVVVDSSKKQADLDLKAQEESEKQDVLEKLKLTDEEFDKLNKTVKK